MVGEKDLHGRYGKKGCYGHKSHRKRIAGNFFYRRPNEKDGYGHISHGAVKWWNEMYTPKRKGPIFL